MGKRQSSEHSASSEKYLNNLDWLKIIFVSFKWCTFQSIKTKVRDLVGCLAEFYVSCLLQIFHLLIKIIEITSNYQLKNSQVT